MQKILAYILLIAKKQNKWVPVKYLVPHGLHRINITNLEDEGLMLKLTMRGYHVFSTRLRTAKE